MAKRRIDLLLPTIVLTLISTIWVKGDGWLLLVAIATYTTLLVGMVLFIRATRPALPDPEGRETRGVGVMEGKMDFDTTSIKTSNLPLFLYSQSKSDETSE